MINVDFSDTYTGESLRQLLSQIEIEAYERAARTMDFLALQEKNLNHTWLSNLYAKAAASIRAIPPLGFPRDSRAGGSPGP